MKIDLINSEDAAPQSFSGFDALWHALQVAAVNSRLLGRVSISELVSESQGTVGLSSTASLSFQYAHGDPPYFVSAGNPDEKDAVLTAYFLQGHHTEIPRSTLIPLSDAKRAIQEFCERGERPTSIQWAEV